MGEAIPTQTRIVLLANWLHVSAHWLRFGGKFEPRESARFGTQDLVLLGSFSLLNSTQKRLAREMIDILMRVSCR